MPKSTYPTYPGDPTLRSCRRCHSQVAQPSMCLMHTRTCMTCCNRLQRGCGLGPREVPTEKYFPHMTWEERQLERTKINRELGFRDYTAQELAEDVKWRDKRS